MKWQKVVKHPHKVETLRRTNDVTTDLSPQEIRGAVEILFRPYKDKADRGGIDEAEWLAYLNALNVARWFLLADSCLQDTVFNLLDAKKKSVLAELRREAKAKMVREC